MNISQNSICSSTVFSSSSRLPRTFSLSLMPSGRGRSGCAARQIQTPSISRMMRFRSWSISSAISFLSFVSSTMLAANMASSSSLSILIVIPLLRVPLGCDIDYVGAAHHVVTAWSIGTASASYARTHREDHPNRFFSTVPAIRYLDLNHPLLPPLPRRRAGPPTPSRSRPVWWGAPPSIASSAGRRRTSTSCPYI